MQDTWVVGVATAAVGFALATTAVPRWIVSGPEQFSGVPDPSWELESRGTPVASTFRDGGVEIRVGCPECRGAVRRAVELGDADGWLVVGRLLLPSPVERARLFLAASCDGDDRWYPQRARVGEEEVTLVVPDPLAGCTVEVGAFVVGDGALDVGRIRVAPARQNPWWTVALVAAIVAYTVAGAASAARLWQASGPWSRLLAVTVGVLVVIGVGLPGARLDVVLLSIPGSDPADLGVDPWVRPTVTGIAQKLGGHGLAFAALGWFGRRTGASSVAVWARCFGFAVATEALQVLVPARSGRWEDVLLDTVAAGIGVGLAALTGTFAPPSPRGFGASPP